MTTGGSPYALLIPLSVFVAILLAKPKTVPVDQNGMQQRHAFGIETIIPWNDVQSISYGANTGTTYVVSKTGGLKIRFSAFLVGQQRFESELRKHLGESVAFEVLPSGDEDQ